MKYVNYIFTSLSNINVLFHSGVFQRKIMLNVIDATKNTKSYFHRITLMSTIFDVTQMFRLINSDSRYVN